MNRDLTALAQPLRQIAYNAGLAVLSTMDAETIRFYTMQYNYIRRQLVKRHPMVASVSRSLETDAAPGDLRLAARALALFVEQETQFFRIGRLAA